MAHCVHLGIDLGAESGRVIAGLWNGKSLRLEELHRFPNGPVPLAGTLRWNVLRLLAEIQNGLALAEKCFVLLTTAANPGVAPIHDRMPFIVRDNQFDRWLNNSDPQLPSSIFHLLDKNPLDFYAVSRKVNNVRNESPDLVRPAAIEKELF